MTSYSLDELFWPMCEPNWTWLDFMFGQLFIWIGENNDQICSWSLDEWFWSMFEPTLTFGIFCDHKAHYKWRSYQADRPLLIENIYVECCGHVYQQTDGVLMGTSCTQFVADLFLYSYEADSVQHPQKS